MRTAARDHLGQIFGIFQHRAGAQVVVVERLALAVLLKKRLLETFEEALFADVRTRVMDEHAGLDVARGVDVAVELAAGDAAACELAVILEVDGEDLLAAGETADLAHAVFHIGALLGIKQQVGRRAHADGHVVEVPGEEAALGDEQVEELVTRDDLVVLARVADGHAERDVVFVHEVHRGERLFKMSRAAAAVVGVLKALDADRDDEVAHALELVAEGLVDERAVREGVEGDVAVLFAQAEDVCLAHERFAAGEEAGVGAELCALGQHTVHLLKGEVLLVAVLRRPAARAAHIAGARRVHEDDPRDIAVILLGVCPCLLEAAEAALIGSGRQEGLEKVGVALAQQALGVVCPFAVGVVCDLVQHFKGLRRPDAEVDLLDHVDKVVCDGADVLRLAFSDERVEHGLKGLALCCVGDFFCCVHSVTIPFPARGAGILKIQEERARSFPSVACAAIFWSFSMRASSCALISAHS